jgi:hypothetical protein
MTHFAHKNRFAPDGKMCFAPGASAPKPRDLAAVLSESLDTALVAHREAEYAAGRGSGTGEVAAKRIGAGYIGTECSRQLAFRYHRFPRESVTSFVSPGELQRHAEAGHWTEAKTAEWLKLAGIDLRTETSDGRQFGYKVARDKETGQARIAGEIDGVILAVPEHLAGLLPVPCLWESKKATAKKWKKFSANGVKKADDRYYGQLQTNMAYLKVEVTLLSMLNLDTMKYFFELVTFDPQAAQNLTDRAVTVLQSQTPFDMPRVAGDPSDWRCKFCPFQITCWDEPKQPDAPKPAWQTHGAQS